MKLFALFVVLLGLLASGCSSDGDSESNTDATELLDEDELELFDDIPDAASQSAEEWSAAVADSWADANPGYSEAQEKCVGEGIVEQISIARLIDLGVRLETIDEGMVNAGFSEDEERLIQSITADCIG